MMSGLSIFLLKKKTKKINEQHQLRNNLQSVKNLLRSVCFRIALLIVMIQNLDCFPVLDIA